MEALGLTQPLSSQHLRVATCRVNVLRPRRESAAPNVMAGAEGLAESLAVAARRSNNSRDGSDVTLSDVADILTLSGRGTCGDCFGVAGRTSGSAMWADNETDVDLLGFDFLVDTLLVALTEPRLLPLTAGLLGDWGSGKSSLLRITRKELIKAQVDRSRSCRHPVVDCR